MASLPYIPNKITYQRFSVNKRNTKYFGVGAITFEKWGCLFGKINKRNK